MLLLFVAILLILALLGGGISLHWLWGAAVIVLILLIAYELAWHERPPRPGP